MKKQEHALVSNENKSNSQVINTGSTMQALKLYYFDTAGKGDCIRLLCAHAGLPLDDIRINQSNGDILTKLRADGKLPFGQLPALQISETGPLIVQSSAIMRFLGKVSGQASLYPSCPATAALIDGIIDEENDLAAGICVSRYRGKRR
jgi:glutathione S-transferase